jgi:hypothetical protein
LRKNKEGGIMPKGKISKNNNKENRKIKCRGVCGRELSLSPSNFFKSNNSEYESIDGYAPYCKGCLRERIFDENGIVDIDKLKETLKILDKPFIRKVFDDVMSKGKFTLGDYTSQLNFGVGKGKQLTYADSDFDKTVVDKNSSKNSSNKELIVTADDQKNEQDVLRILGYDPFESENIADKKYLYNRLIDFLDESTLEDSFKLPAVIEIVKSFNQIDKINQAIANITSDIDKMASGGNVIKSLIDSKEKMLKTILALAKDNGISVNHNNSKSKGSGTLSGIMKKLQELGFDEASINLFDVETANGIRQVADISNNSILSQLMFDENDYSEMIKEQRILIDEYRSKCEKLEEDNRQLKIKLYNLKDGGL